MNWNKKMPNKEGEGKIRNEKNEDLQTKKEKKGFWWTYKTCLIIWDRKTNEDMLVEYKLLTLFSMWFPPFSKMRSFMQNKEEKREENKISKG